jgi:hypothetical protein
LAAKIHEIFDIPHRPIKISDEIYRRNLAGDGRILCGRFFASSPTTPARTDP